MPKIVIAGIPAYNGEYEFDGDLTAREHRRIKQITGLAGTDLDHAMDIGDADVLVGIAVVVLERHGIEVDPELLWDGKLGSIAPEDDAGPPELNGSDGKNSEDERSSGDGSPPLSETPASLLEPTGGRV